MGRSRTAWGRPRWRAVAPMYQSRRRGSRRRRHGCPGVGAGQADGAGGGVGAVLAEADQLGAGHQVDDAFGDFHLDWVGQEKMTPF